MTYLWVDVEAAVSDDPLFDPVSVGSRWSPTIEVVTMAGKGPHDWSPESSPVAPDTPVGLTCLQTTTSVYSMVGEVRAWAEALGIPWAGLDMGGLKVAVPTEIRTGRIAVKGTLRHDSHALADAKLRRFVTNEVQVKALVHHGAYGAPVEVSSTDGFGLSAPRGRFAVGCELVDVAP